MCKMDLSCLEVQTINQSNADLEHGIVELHDDLVGNLARSSKDGEECWIYIWKQETDVWRNGPSTLEHTKKKKKKNKKKSTFWMPSIIE